MAKRIAKPKPKSLGDMRPRKKTALEPSEREKIARGKTWRLNIGTPNEPAETDLRYETMAEMKQAAIKALRDWEPRCRSFENEALPRLQKAIAQVDALTTFGREPVIIDVLLDSYYSVTIRLVLCH